MGGEPDRIPERGSENNVRPRTHAQWSPVFSAFLELEAVALRDIVSGRIGRSLGRAETRDDLAELTTPLEKQPEGRGSNPGLLSGTSSRGQAWAEWGWVWVCPDLPDHGMILVSALGVGHPSAAQPLKQPPELHVRGICLRWSPGQAISDADRYQGGLPPKNARERGIRSILDMSARETAAACW